MSTRWEVISAVFAPVIGLSMALVLILAVIAVPIMASSASCSGFGEVTGRVVQFRHYGVASWDCFVRTADGKWLPKGQLRDVAP